MIVIQNIDIKSSSGKVTGHIEKTEDKIKIINGKKPIVEIEDKDIIERINNREESVIIQLYDEYTLLISEIAALFGINYSNMNKKIKTLDVKTKSKSGRRNSSFGQTFSEKRRKHIGESHLGKSPSTPPYIRTPEIRQRISETLKEGFKSGRIVVNGEALSKAWKDGKYENSPMGRGIQGYVHIEKSAKESKDIYFRSLLELFYLLEAEEDPNIITIASEPVHIKLIDNSIYVPDFLINDELLIELKPHNHMKWRKDSVDNRFEKEMDGAKRFCEEKNWKFKLIYDIDIGFETKKYKKFLLSHPEIIEKYNIRFNKPLKPY